MSALTPEQRRAERLARAFDLRSFIGSLFVLSGVMVTFAGLTASRVDIDNALGVNLSLWMGPIMIAVGIFFIAWMLAAPPGSSTATGSRRRTSPSRCAATGRQATEPSAVVRWGRSSAVESPSPVRRS
jgi:hypothetical protein